MSRRWMPITLVALVCVALIAVVVMVVGMLVGRAGTSPHVERVSEAAFTPEEVTVTATANTDGTLAVTEKLVFDTPEGSTDPVSWYIGASRIGWETRDRHTQLIVLPTVSDVTGVVLTDDGPGDELTVDKDDSKVDDPMYDSVAYRFTAAEGEWSAGRHAVQVSYVLDDVHVRVDGADLMVLPLSFARGPHRTVSYRSIDVGDGNAISCMPDNMTFELNDECTRLQELATRTSESRIAWRDEPTGPVEAIAFAMPSTVTAEPISVIRKEV
ncbi:DUF2207 domain-containing protein [Microbacterium sp. MPKO10]|uniref:DUF2207 domain-containing protein n=1 Tax=Microbacterium sp. MPKO10 TaxID=2989818 RepID=UPI002235A37D|nr:DUF2207 domain-containing protein [Microbacterium sp. MPKO10]MCW4460000.1 hypothetical protein [Microbacterium sp. MPKO10]